jgi:hypothetical protein
MPAPPPGLETGEDLLLPEASVLDLTCDFGAQHSEQLAF